MTWEIQRTPGSWPGRSAGTAFGPFGWAVATADDKSCDLAGQTRASFAKIERILASLGTTKAYLLSVSVYLADVAAKPAFEALWREWVGDDPAHWPQRSCVGVDLSAGTLVELVVVAARPPGSTGWQEPERRSD